MRKVEAKLKFEVRTHLQRFEVELDQLSGEQFRVRVGGSPPIRELEIRLVSRTRHRWTVSIGGRIHDLVVLGEADETRVDWGAHSRRFSVVDQRRRRFRQVSGREQDGIAVLKAQMPGKVIRVIKQEGDAVEAGDGLAIIEAMKMQNELKSPKSGRVRACRLSEGDTVNAGVILYEIE